MLLWRPSVLYSQNVSVKSRWVLYIYPNEGKGSVYYAMQTLKVQLPNVVVKVSINRKVSSSGQRKCAVIFACLCLFVQRWLYHYVNSGELITEHVLYRYGTILGISCLNKL